MNRRLGRRIQAHLLATDQERLDEMCSASGLQLSWLVRQLVHEALKARQA